MKDSSISIGEPAREVKAITEAASSFQKPMLHSSMPLSVDKKYLKDHHFDFGLKTAKNQQAFNRFNLTYDSNPRMTTDLRGEADTLPNSMERVIQNKVKIDPIPEAKETKMKQKSIEKDQRMAHFKIGWDSRSSTTVQTAVY